MAYTGKLADGSVGTIVSDIKSLCGINVSQERWDETFGKKDGTRQRGYRCRKYFTTNGKRIFEETWFETVGEESVECRRKIVDGAIKEYYENGERKI